MAKSKLTSDPNITVPVVLRLSVLRRLTAEAESQGLSRSALVRRAVLALVTDQPASATEVQP